MEDSALKKQTVQKVPLENLVSGRRGKERFKGRSQEILYWHETKCKPVVYKVTQVTDVNTKLKDFIVMGGARRWGSSQEPHPRLLFPEVNRLSEIDKERRGRTQRTEITRIKSRWAALAERLSCLQRRPKMPTLQVRSPVRAHTRINQ